MGLYDDEVDAARASAVYTAVRRAMEARLDSTERLSAAVGALRALEGEFPGIAGMDGDVASWRLAAVRAARALRGAAGWDAVARDHPEFIRLLDVPDGLKRFATAGRFGYELWHPDTWRTRVSEDESLFETSPEPDFRDVVRVAMESGSFEPTVEAYATHAVSRLRRAEPGCSIRAHAMRTLDGVDARELEVALRPDSRELVILAVHGGAGLTIVYRASEERFARYEAAARAIIESLRLKGE